jgi:DNA-binding response OmpR family regulator
VTTAPVVHTLPGPTARLLTAVPSGDQAETVAELVGLVRRLTDLVARLDGSPGAAPTAVEPLRLGGLCLDPGSYLAVVDGRPVDLTAREFQLLWELARSSGRALTRSELLCRLGEDGDGGRGRVVDVHVARLRRKLGPLAGQLVTVRGVGYRLDAS